MRRRSLSGDSHSSNCVSEHGAGVDDTWSRLIQGCDIVHISEGEGSLGRVGACFCDMQGAGVCGVTCTGLSSHTPPWGTFFKLHL